MHDSPTTDQSASTPPVEPWRQALADVRDACIAWSQAYAASPDHQSPARLAAMEVGAMRRRRLEQLEVTGDDADAALVTRWQAALRVEREAYVADLPWQSQPETWRDAVRATLALDREMGVPW